MWAPAATSSASTGSSSRQNEPWGVTNGRADGTGPVHDQGLWRSTGPAFIVSAGRRQDPVSVSGAGETDIAALFDFHGRLTGMPLPADDAARRTTLNRRLRQGVLPRRGGGSSEERASFGRARLARVLEDYPGDVQTPSL